MRRLDLAGQRFGQLTVGARAPNQAGGKHVAWYCRCDCGQNTVVTTAHLRSGHTTSCGCVIAARRNSGMLHRTHGHGVRGRTSPEYRSWASAKQRCFNENDAAFRLYGARGVTMCERWSTSFEAFLADMGRRPPGASLDRIDSDGNYEPGNCRWATATQQANNTRRNLFVEYEGDRLTLEQLARRVGVDARQLWKLYRRRGLPLLEAIETARRAS